MAADGWIRKEGSAAVGSVRSRAWRPAAAKNAERRGLKIRDTGRAIAARSGQVGRRRPLPGKPQRVWEDFSPDALLWFRGDPARERRD